MLVAATSAVDPGSMAAPSTGSPGTPLDTQAGGGAGALGLPADLSGDAEAQGFADLLFANGMASLADKRYEEARPLFEKAAATWPRDATYAYLGAICTLRIAAYRHTAGGALWMVPLHEAIEVMARSLPPAPNRVPLPR